MSRLGLSFWCLACACNGSASTGSAAPTPVLPLAPPAPVAAPLPPPAPSPAADISGRWECIWNLPGASGAETWMLIQDGSAIRVTLTGRDPGGRYTGTMNGTIADRRLQLAFTYHDHTRGTMSLLVSANGQVIDGDSVRAVGGNVSHYGCSRP